MGVHGLPLAPQGRSRGLLPSAFCNCTFCDHEALTFVENKRFVYTNPLLFAIVRSACTKRLLLLKTNVSCTRNPYFLGCSICTVCTRVLKGRALNPCACAQKQRGHFGGVVQNTLAAIIDLSRARRTYPSTRARI